MAYDGSPITVDDENTRQQQNLNHSRSSAWSQLRIEKVLILQFNKEGNEATIKLTDNTILENVRVKTPLEYILFMYGELEFLHNIEGILTYRTVPSGGLVELGDMYFKKEKENSRDYFQPFYL